MNLFSKMLFIVMFVTAVCVLFTYYKLRWLKEKSIYAAIASISTKYFCCDLSLFLEKEKDFVRHFLNNLSPVQDLRVNFMSVYLYIFYESLDHEQIINMPKKKRMFENCLQ